MRTKLKKALQLIAIVAIGIFLVATVVGFAKKSAEGVKVNGAIPPPEGYPKLSLSTKVVTPTLAGIGGEELKYRLEIVNTGAYTAEDVTLTDPIPLNATYKAGSVWSSVLPAPVYATTPDYPHGVILWEHGEVGFDTTVVITFGVDVAAGTQGIVTNTAVISDPMIAAPVTVMAETRVTDHPIFEISKTATPAMPGKNKPLTYELSVTNVGQPAVNTPIIVTDFIPQNTTFVKAGQGGTAAAGAVTWEPSVNQGYGATTTFTFTVNVNSNVTSGTVLTNEGYNVVGPEEIGYGEPYTTTVVDPILYISKSISPDPPGGNSVVTYTLTVLNLGSKATVLEISDTVPQNVTYIGGGDSFAGGVVTWHLASLDTGESAQVSFTGSIGDIAGIVLLNDDYSVCSAEGVCAQGTPVPSLLIGPMFEVTATLDPIAHKPGGGDETTVTPTLTIKNLGPGNAIDATARLMFGRITVSNLDVLKIVPQTGTPPGQLFAGPPCNVGFQCDGFSWIGSLDVGDMITITTNGGQSTIGGEEGTHYTATVVVTDALGSFVTEPITATAIGHVTHMSNLIPTKSAPPKIGPGQTMTYTIQVFDSGLSTEATPVLTETVPPSVTLVVGSISDGGTFLTNPQGETVVSWNLPDMGPGDFLYRSFSVVVDSDLVSGTLIVNDEYQTSVFESSLKGIKVVVGEPVTTTIHEVGLIDSYKTVTPVWAPPGEDTVLTWTIHVVNSGPKNLTGVHVSDVFPWAHSTYQRDAVASSCCLSSDIVSLQWVGNVNANSEQLITFTTKVDDFFEGELVNRATITHSSLVQPVEISAVAFITNKPVLGITKTASPDPVAGGGTLVYEIEVTNIGRDATLLTITDTVPGNTTYIDFSASSGGELQDNLVRWSFPVLKQGDKLNLSFMVTVDYGEEVVNSHYAVRSAEGASAYGAPVVTRVVRPHWTLFLPTIQKH